MNEFTPVGLEQFGAMLMNDDDYEIDWDLPMEGSSVIKTFKIMSIVASLAAFNVWDS